MDGTFKIGRIFGFEINVHWSWLFIFVLLTATFSEQFFQEWTWQRRWIVGATVSLIFFVSILLHEMSHSVLARRYGIPVSSITLFIFGGVSNLSKEPENARQEFWIAIVGPLTSLVLAGTFGIAYIVLDPLQGHVADIALQLAAINLSIGIFNLVPGFPLDGGRVLRSLFWARKRNILDATKLASSVGVIVAYVIMGLGVFFFLSNPVMGIWFFLIGNFLRTSASASYQQLVVDTVLKGVPANVVLRTDFQPLDPTLTLAELVDNHLLGGNTRYFPVMAGQEILGLVTLTDLRKVPREDWGKTTVYRAMTPLSRLRTVGPRDELMTVLQMMATADVNQVPMLDNQILLGFIERGDVLRYMQVRRELSSGQKSEPPSGRSAQ